ncbi:hypothetical protein AB0O22_19765 [Streptomyces sp. NPDC091204]|uniref:hypothetical protein n=1 Tax=Streptomyces sp. NPDC091204 TaxID=3155299 RepID=UPI00343C39B6
MDEYDAHARRHIALPEGRDRWELAPDQEERVITVLFELFDEFRAEREATASAT